MRGNSPGVELFYAAKLIGLQARRVPYYVLDSFCPPFSRFPKARRDTRRLRELASITFSFGLKLQEE
jgi:hypothetical protein